MVVGCGHMIKGVQRAVTHMDRVLSPSIPARAHSTSTLATVSTAGASSVRQVLACSASSPSGQTRVGFLKNTGLAAAVVASIAVPAAAMAEVEEEEEEVVKVGEEVITGSGLKYVVTVAGKGAKPKVGNTIKAHYTG